VVREGDKIQVKLIEIDKAGRLNLSYIDAIDPGFSNEGSRGSSGGNSSGGSSDNRRDFRRH